MFIPCVFTRMFPDASVYDLVDVFVGLRVVLQAVVTQGDVVGQSWERSTTGRTLIKPVSFLTQTTTYSMGQWSRLISYNPETFKTRTSVPILAENT